MLNASVLLALLIPLIVYYFNFLSNGTSIKIKIKPSSFDDVFIIFVVSNNDLLTEVYKYNFIITASFNHNYSIN